MQRPTQRHEALRQRVVAGRERQSAKQRRAAVARKGGRRVIAIGAGLAMVAGVLTVTQLASSALEDEQNGLGAGACQETVEEVSTNDMELHEEVAEDGTVHRHYRQRGWGDEDEPTEEPAPNDDECVDDGSGDGTGGGGGQDGGGDGTGDGGDGDGGDGTGDGGDGDGGDGTGDGGDGDGGDPNADADGDGIPDDPNGLGVIARNCASFSDLPIHPGFQTEEATCAETQAGEASAFENNPSLLIAEAPDWVGVNEPFSVTVSTRNLLRDRFLGAGAGGYYQEMSVLDENGIQRGHFHFACTELVDGNVAPTPEALESPGFFVAVEDSQGGAGVNNVTLEVTGLADPGMYRCMAWAGDGSHRVPMTTFARMQIPVDTFRLTVSEQPEGEG